MLAPSQIPPSPDAQATTTRWHYYLYSRDAWDAMYKDCNEAQTSIAYEQYILDNDEVGRRFMDLFIRKAKEGVQVVLVCDQFGSRRLYKSAIVDEFRKAGGQFYFYHPVNFFTKLVPWLCFPRTHTKTLLIDSQIAYGGGVCVAEYMHTWRDTQMRVIGPVTHQIEYRFNELISQLTSSRGEKILRRLWHIGHRQPSLPADDGFQYQMNRPGRASYAMYKDIMRAIGRAEQYVYITSAFFIPGHRFFKQIRKARERGVDVRVMLPQKSDVPLADLICMSYFHKLLKDGIRIFYYQPTVLHTKSAVVDGKWATVGSTNFDLLSFFYNREANFIVTDTAAISQLEQHFYNDLQACVEVTREYLRQVPLWKKIVGYAGRIIKMSFGS